MRHFLLALLMMTTATLAENPADQPAEQPGGQTVTSPEASTTVKLTPAKKLSPAEMRAEQLDRLFGSLQANTGLRDPAKTQASIWELWSQSDSATADVLLGQSAKALDDEEPNIAEELINGVIANYPDYAEAYNKRATLYFRMRRYDASLKDIEKVLDLEPRHFGALSGRGMIYQQQGKTRDALKALREALAINPHLKSVERAIKLMEKAEPDI
jgi:tetratricopeptide (TPR) repeat protein